MSWIEKLLPPRINRSGAQARQSIPAGLWIKCPACGAVLYRADLEANLHVCPECAHHLRIRARRPAHAMAHTDSGYRLYNRADVARLHQIQALRRFGMSLADIGTFLASPDAPFADVVAQQIATLDRQIAQASALREQLSQLHRQMAGGGALDADELRRMHDGAGKHGAQWMALIAAVHRQLDAGADDLPAPLSKRKVKLRRAHYAVGGAPWTTTSKAITTRIFSSG